MQIILRPGRAEDFDYCKRLYFSGMETIIRELNLDRAAQNASFHQYWDWTQVRIITFNGADIGWLQCTTQDGAVYLAQLYVDGPFQRRGIGTEVIRLILDEAASAGLALTLSVVKTNPALQLYLRLGFRIMHEDERKFHMRRDPGIETPISN
jgi:ribosomal protein S18 acetylase RimI-like enzyme